jgi:hypothetical protein
MCRMLTSGFVLCAVLWLLIIWLGCSLVLSLLYVAVVSAWKNKN